MKKKKKSQTKLFASVFVVLAVVVVLQNLLREKITLLPVLNNAGVTVLETVDNDLVCVFQDGQVTSWDWNTLSAQQADFKAPSDRTIVLDAEHLAAVNKEGQKMLAVYGIPDGQKQNDMKVAWQDQDVWLRISPDKNTLVLIRRNSPDSKQNVLFGFLTVDVDKQLLSLPVTVSITQDTEDFVDYAVDNNGILIAVGSQNGLGRIVAVDLQKGKIRWDTTFSDTKEFCSVISPSDSSIIYAGNRDGFLYKINLETSEIIKKIQLLEPGETRPITNDFSVLNLAFSPDGQYYVATINPKAYVLKTDSDEIIHSWNPVNKLVSKIAFSPDNQFVATSDIRAGYPVKIWPLPEEN